MTKKYFPNNWQGIHDTPDEAFAELAFDDFMEMAHHWHVPSSHACIMRIENTNSGQIQEIAYKTVGRAQRKIMNLIEDPANVITICDDESIHLLKYPDDPDA